MGLTDLEATRDLLFCNSFEDIESILQTCFDNGTRFELECYDIAHLYNLAHFEHRWPVKPLFVVQSVFGVLGGIGNRAGTPRHEGHARTTFGA